MKQSPKICILGDVIVDVSLNTESGVKMRLGGIIHSARTLWALGMPFSVAYFSPAYLDDQITSYLHSLGCEEIFKLGNVTGSPYVFLIDDVKETGNQGYEFLLREEIKIEYNSDAFELLQSKNNYDYLVISGNYDISILNQINGTINIDVANNVKDILELKNIEKKIETLFISTSSTLFLNFYNNDFRAFVDLFQNISKNVVVKENRGGSRAINFAANSIIEIDSQTQPIVNSVGVGDAYAACFVSISSKYIFQDALVLSSWIATEYALTTYPDDFKKGVSRVMKAELKDLRSMKGVSMPWEKRKDIHIYIAAPDFDFVDISPLEKLVNNLKYHNFTPHRPVRENGQMEENAPKHRRQELFNNDMILLEKCSILVAVMLYDDPGTLIEIGLSAAKGMPTIVYDPYQKANNCMLTELPTLVSSDLDVIISEVFLQASKITKYE